MIKVNRISSKIINNEIILNQSESSVAKLVENGETFIIEKCFNKELLKGIIIQVLEFYLPIKPEFMNIKWGIRDFWRIDNNPSQSSLKKLQSLYFFFPWNSKFSKVKEIGEMIGRLRNRLAGLPLKFGIQQNDDYYSYTLLQHYPAGGGMGKHQDPLNPQKCVVTLIVNNNFKTGGLYMENEGKNVSLENLLEPGDLFIHRPDIPHGVAPIVINEKDTMDFFDFSGRWRLANILTPAI